jgi:uncharacterized protein YbjT (DUF2867 family)
MKVLVLGANGKTGGYVVDRALAAGHHVTVLVRDPAKFNKPGVRVLTGDATKANDVLSAILGQQAVIDSIGGTTPYKSTTLETTAVRNVIDAMKAEHATRLIVVSMMGIGESRAQAPFWYKYLLMPTFLRGSTQDKINMEHAVETSGLQYVIARPPILEDTPATGSIRILGPGEIGHSITRADLAAFLVDQIDSPANIGKAVTIVNN